MKILKPHFWYNKSQRNGVFFLLLIIVVFQLLYSFIDNSNKKEYFSNNEVVALQKQIDSLKIVEKEKSKPKVFPFNPNYLTDYKASQLGLSISEIDRLLAYRNKDKFINSKEDFKRVTNVSDSLLDKISPYFKFPDWVINQNKKKAALKNKGIKKVNVSTTHLNLATAEDFESIEGVNEFLAKRIVKYRSKLQGYTFESQLLEVWKIEKDIVDRILKTFQIKSKPIIKKVNVNIASFKQVLSTPYIDYELCKKIFDFRDEVAELQSIEELKNIQGFPLEKYDRIVLYLEAK